MTMSDRGYRRRIECIEWWGEMFRRHGSPVEQCGAMIRHCSECLDSDYYGEPRPIATEEWLERTVAHFDNLFASTSRMPVGPIGPDRWQPARDYFA